MLQSSTRAPHGAVPLGSPATWLAALAVGAVIGGAVFGHFSHVAARATHQRVVDEEWRGLLTCLSGGRPPAEVHRLPERMRQVELGYVAAADAAEGRRVRALWLDHCAIATTRIKAVASTDRDGPTAAKDLRYQESVDEVGDALKTGRVPSAASVAALVESASALGLGFDPLPSFMFASPENPPLVAPAALPPAALAPGTFALGATDPIPSRDAHVLLEHDKQGRACVFTGGASAPLSTYRCADVPQEQGDSPTWRWESPNEIEDDVLTATVSHTSHAFRLANGKLSLMGTFPGEMAGVVGEHGRPRLIAFEGRERLGIYRADAAELERVRGLTISGLQWILPMGDEVVWGVSTPGGGERALASDARRFVAGGAGTLRATVGEQDLPLACEHGDTRVVVLGGRAGRGAYSWERDTVVLFRDGSGWRAPVRARPRWEVAPTSGAAYPGAPALTCDRGSAALTWTHADNRNLVRQLRCTPNGCSTHETRVGVDMREALVANVGDRVLLVWNDVQHRVIRMRAAPIERLAQTNDRILYDDGPAHNDAPPSSATHLLVREGAALVVLKIMRAGESAVHAVRIDAQGRVTLPQATP